MWFSRLLSGIITFIFQNLLTIILPRQSNSLRLLRACVPFQLLAVSVAIGILLHGGNDHAGGAGLLLITTTLPLNSKQSALLLRLILRRLAAQRHIGPQPARVLRAYGHLLGVDSSHHR